MISYAAATSVIVWERFGGGKNFTFLGNRIFEQMICLRLNFKAVCKQQVSKVISKENGRHHRTSHEN